MASRLPALPTLPPHVDPAVRLAYEKMREYVYALSGTRGDPRDARLTSEEASSLYNRIYLLERQLLEASHDAVRVAELALAEAGDVGDITSFVVTSGDFAGSLHPADGADTIAFSAALSVTGEVAATESDELGGLIGETPYVYGTSAPANGADVSAISGTVA